MNISVFRCRLQLPHRHNQRDGAENFIVLNLITMLNLHFFLVVRDNFKILYILFLLFIQIKFPAFKDYICKNFKWFDSHAKKIEKKW